MVESFAAGLAARRMSAADLDRLVRLQRAMEDSHARGDRIGYIRLNQKIHTLIVAGAANPALTDVYRRLIGRLQRARNVGLSTLGRVEESIAEHRQILAMLQARDADEVQRLFRIHVERTGDLVAAHCARTTGRSAAPIRPGALPA